jgi:hypothetical protein
MRRVMDPLTAHCAFTAVISLFVFLTTWRTFYGTDIFLRIRYFLAALEKICSKPTLSDPWQKKASSKYDKWKIRSDKSPYWH